MERAYWAQTISAAITSLEISNILNTVLRNFVCNKFTFNPMQKKLGGKM